MAHAATLSFVFRANRILFLLIQNHASYAAAQLQPRAIYQSLKNDAVRVSYVVFRILSTLCISDQFNTTIARVISNTDIIDHKRQKTELHTEDRRSDIISRIHKTMNYTNI